MCLSTVISIAQTENIKMTIFYKSERKGTNIFFKLLTFTVILRKQVSSLGYKVPTI